jgi:hypothetical protein
MTATESVCTATGSVAPAIASARRVVALLTSVQITAPRIHGTGVDRRSTGSSDLRIGTNVHHAG